MKKFLAIVNFEYRKIIFKWSFLVGTFLLPLIFLAFAFVPALIFSMRGEPTRVLVADPSGKIAARLSRELSAERSLEVARQRAADAAEAARSRPGSDDISALPVPQSFIISEFPVEGRSRSELGSLLNARVAAGEADAYLIVPANIEDLSEAYEFRSRRSGDIVAESAFRDALNNAVRSQRLADANIDESRLQHIGQKVNFDSKGIDDKGAEKDTSGVMAAAFIIGLMIYITLAIYGQAIMGAVVEEKETRIAEVLFSSARPFQLMMGKLVGVGLAGLTQLTIWVVSAAILGAFLAYQAYTMDMMGSIPPITPLMLFYFLVFFLLGFFSYAAIFALIGAMVTTVQEGGQFAFPPIMLLLVGFYLSFAVIRDPNSTLSFWVSIAPFFAPITMPVRILAETPPVWQILLAFLLNGLAIAGLIWLASRVYRVGMLMYGKRSTIPEVWKWIKQA